METKSEYNCITDVQPIAPVYPVATYKPLNIQVRIVEVEQNDNLERSYKVETLDGAYRFSWSSWEGGKGYTWKQSNWTWCSENDLTIQKPRCFHSTVEIVEVSIEDYPTGFSNGDVTYASGTKFVSRCMTCGETWDDVPHIPEFESECNIEDEE